MWASVTERVTIGHLGGMGDAWATPCSRAPRAGTALPAFELCRRFGMRVYEIEDLDQDVVYVEGQNIGLVRTDLSQPDRQWAAEWLLSAALCELIALAP